MEEPNILESEANNNNNELSADGTEDVPMEIVKNDEVTPARLLIKDFDDENEETIRLTVEEAHNYILSEVGKNLRDSDINPFLDLKNKIETVKDTIEEQMKETNRMKKMFDILCNNQEKYLRLTGVVPKVEKRNIGVTANLPFLPEEVLNCCSEDILHQTVNTSSKVPKSDEPIQCIDLTDDEDEPGSSNSISAVTENVADTESTAELAATTSTSSAVTSFASSDIHSQTNRIIPTVKTLQHPAPLPAVPDGTDGSKVLPKPNLKISADKNGIVLQWNLPPEAKDMKIMGFELFGYQEKNNVPISSALWKRIGFVDPLPLPMSCTLTQFMEGVQYHFSVRAFSKDNSVGHFSDPASVKLCFS